MNLRGFFRRWIVEDEGVLTFEWILLLTVLVIGIVGGLSAVRDALITELGDVAEAMISLDQSYTVLPPWEVTIPDCVQDGASDSYYVDAAYISEQRASGHGAIDLFRGEVLPACGIGP